MPETIAADHLRISAVTLAAATAAFTLSGPAPADTITLTSVRDNTLTQDPEGNVSNGAGQGIFSGRLASIGGGLKIRAVLAFDLDPIPPGSVITDVKLVLTLMMGVGGPQTHTLHRILADWGEGTSMNFGALGSPATPNDATWLHAKYPNDFWNQPGGDFAAAASASQTVTNSGVFTWTSAGMIADAQAWLNDPAGNFGWLIRGNEAILKTAKKFASKENTTASQRPALIITYTPPPPAPCPGDITANNVVNIDDLLAVINAWGPCPLQPDPCPADITPASGGGGSGNGVVDIDDLLTVINGWGPCT